MKKGTASRDHPSPKRRVTSRGKTEPFKQQPHPQPPETTPAAASKPRPTLTVAADSDADLSQLSQLDLAKLIEKRLAEGDNDGHQAAMAAMTSRTGSRGNNNRIHASEAAAALQPLPLSSAGGGAGSGGGRPQASTATAASHALTPPPAVAGVSNLTASERELMKVIQDRAISASAEFPTTTTTNNLTTARSSYNNTSRSSSNQHRNQSPPRHCLSLPVGIPVIHQNNGNHHSHINRGADRQQQQPPTRFTQSLSVGTAGGGTAGTAAGSSEGSDRQFTQSLTVGTAAAGNNNSNNNTRGSRRKLAQSLPGAYMHVPGGSAIHLADLPHPVLSPSTHVTTRNAGCCDDYTETSTTWDMSQNLPISSNGSSCNHWTNPDQIHSEDLAILGWAPGAEGAPGRHPSRPRQQPPPNRHMTRTTTPSGVTTADPPSIVSQTKKRQEETATSFWKTKKYCVILIVLLFIVIAAVVVVAVIGTSVGNKKKSSSSSSSHSEGSNEEEVPLVITLTTVGPTAPPTDDRYVLPLPAYTKASIEKDPESAQARAYEWLLEDSLLHNYSQAKQWQRLGLATLYFATTDIPVFAATHAWMTTSSSAYQQKKNGTTKSDGFEEDRHDECHWFSDEARGLGPPPECGENGLYERFVLEGYNLQGSLPPEISLLKNLSYLGLDRNALTGTIPPDLFISWSQQSQRNMEAVLLRGNQLHGGIPPEIGLVKVDFLLLGSNQLEGSLPVSLVNSQATWLDCSDNLLWGPIPTALGMSPRLKGLNLATNMLTGTLPTELASVRL